MYGKFFMISVTSKTNTKTVKNAIKLIFKNVLKIRLEPPPLKIKVRLF